MHAKEILNWIHRFLVFSLKGPFNAIRDDKPEEVDVNNAISDIVDSIYKPRFVEKDSYGDSKIILDARKRAIGNDKMTFMNGRLQIVIKGCENTAKASDIVNISLINEYNDYIPRLIKFLQTSNKLLVKEKPDEFLISYAKFFDDFLLEYVKYKLKQDFEVHNSDLLVENVCSMLFITEEVKRLLRNSKKSSNITKDDEPNKNYEPNNKKELVINGLNDESEEKGLKWNDCFKEITKIFENNYKAYTNPCTEETLTMTCNPVNDI